MAIKIVGEKDIELTQAEYNFYQSEYRKTYQFYSGVVPDFETFVRDRKNQKFIDGML